MKSRGKKGDSWQVTSVINLQHLTNQLKIYHIPYSTIRRDPHKQWPHRKTSDHTLKGLFTTITNTTYFTLSSLLYLPIPRFWNRWSWKCAGCLSRYQLIHVISLVDETKVPYFTYEQLKFITHLLLIRFCEQKKISRTQSSRYPLVPAWRRGKTWDPGAQLLRHSHLRVCSFEVVTHQKSNFPRG